MKKYNIYIYLFFIFIKPDSILASKLNLELYKSYYHIGLVKEAHNGLWKMIRIDNMRSQSLYSSLEKAEIYRLIGSSSYVLLKDAEFTESAYAKSLIFNRKQNLVSSELRNEKLIEIFKETENKSKYQIFNKINPVKVGLVIDSLNKKSKIQSAIITVKETYSPFDWNGQSLNLLPGSHSLKIEAPGYEPVNVKWNVKKNVVNTIPIRLKPISFLFNKKNMSQSSKSSH